MAAKAVVAPEAERDIAEAYVWYESRRIGLGEEFLGSVDAVIERICRQPLIHAVVHEAYRRSHKALSICHFLRINGNERNCPRRISHLAGSAEMAAATPLTPPRGTVALTRSEGVSYRTIGRCTTRRRGPGFPMTSRLIVPYPSTSPNAVLPSSAVPECDVARPEPGSSPSRRDLLGFLLVRSGFRNGYRMDGLATHPPMPFSPAATETGQAASMEGMKETLPREGTRCRIDAGFKPKQKP